MVALRHRPDRIQFPRKFVDPETRSVPFYRRISVPFTYPLFQADIEPMAMAVFSSTEINTQRPFGGVRHEYRALLCAYSG